MYVYIYIQGNKRFRHDLKPSFTSSGFFWHETSRQTWLRKRTGKSPSSGLLQVRKNGGCSLPTWSCNPPKQKKTLRVWSECDWNFGHCCVAFMFPFFFLLQPTHLSASCPETPKPQIPTPSSPWSPYVHPSGIPIKIPFLFITKEPSEPPGCRKKWQIVKGLLIGSLLGRLPFANFLAIPGGFPRMLWNDPIYTVWQEKWPARPSTKKISWEHKNQAKKKFGSGCSGLDAEI